MINEQIETPYQLMTLFHMTMLINVSVCENCIRGVTD